MAFVPDVLIDGFRLCYQFVRCLSREGFCFFLSVRFAAAFELDFGCRELLTIEGGNVLLSSSTGQGSCNVMQEEFAGA